MQQELVQVHHVAKMLGVSNKRVYQMVQEGKLQGVRLSARALRIQRSSIHDFVEKSMVACREELGLMDIPQADLPAQRIHNRRHL